MILLLIIIILMLIMICLLSNYWFNSRSPLLGSRSPTAAARSFAPPVRPVGGPELISIV